MGADHDDAGPYPTAAMRLGLRTVVLLGIAFGGLFATGALDPVELLLPGQKGAGGAVMVEDFGADRIPDGYSYDGQQYYLAARFLPDVEAAGEIVGGPRFRLLRVVLPLLASPGGEGTAVVVLLVAWNVVGIGLAVGSMADLAARHGRPPVVGVAAALGLALPLLLTGGECLAFGLGLFALCLGHRERPVWALATLAVAGLTRETALTFGVGLLAYWVAQRRWTAVASLPLAAVPVALWRGYLHRAVDGPDAPVALFDFVRIAERPAVDQVLTVVVVLLGAYAVVHWRDAVLLWPVVAGWLAWFLVYEYDTYDWRALPRVSAPLLILGLAGLAADARSLLGGRDRPRTEQTIAGRR